LKVAGCNIENFNVVFQILQRGAGYKFLDEKYGRRDSWPYADWHIDQPASITMATIVLI
jgi:hypothetical protein